MPLFRLFGYSVSPQRTESDEAFSAPEGGAITVERALRDALDDALAKAEREDSTHVKLRVALDGSRASELRDNVMDFLFAAQANAAEPHALALATRLSLSMDHRSDPCLFLVAGYRDSASAAARGVALWVFPREGAFRFRSRQHQIEIIEDSFSRTSHLRKLALMKGSRVRGQFHEADVLDYQARGRPGQIADFWIDSFLEADPAILDDVGTRYLADIIAGTSAELTDVADVDQLQAAVFALRNAPVVGRDIIGVGREFLDGEARRVFEERAAALLPNADARQTVFRINRAEFGRRLQLRTFRLAEGTRVLAPISTVGPNGTVRVTRRDRNGEDVEMLVVEDVVLEDKIR